MIFIKSNKFILKNFELREKNNQLQNQGEYCLQIKFEFEPRNLAFKKQHSISAGNPIAIGCKQFNTFAKKLDKD